MRQLNTEDLQVISGGVSSGMLLVVAAVITLTTLELFYMMNNQPELF